MEQHEQVDPFLVRLRQGPDWPAVDGLIGHLRRRSPAAVNTNELALAIGRPKRQVYAVVKLARRVLALTTGECMPNIRKVGYRITNQPRALLFESIKAGNRADGHLGSEVENFRRVDRATLTSTADVELYVTQQARIRLGEARLALSKDIAPAMQRMQTNAALAATAQRDALTPWQDLGLDDHEGNGGDGRN